MTLVACRPNPFDTGRELRVVEGLAVARIVELAITEIAWRDHAFVSIGGRAIPRDAWESCVPEAGETVTVTIVPEGGDFLRIGLTIAVIAAAAWAGPAAAGALGLTAVGAGGAVTLTTAGLAVSGAVGAAVTTVGMLAVNTLVPPPQPGLSGGSRGSPAYSIDGARNSARLRGPVAVVLGRHRRYPDLAAETVTEVAGGDVYLRMLVCWGYGPVELTDIRIGETPVDEFDDVEIEHWLGGPGPVPVLSLYSDDIHQEQLNDHLTFKAGWVTRRTLAGIDEISIDLTFPAGLIGYGKKTGDKLDQQVSMRIEYRAVGDEAWTAHGDVLVRATTASALRRNIRLAVPNGEYDVRIRRLTADSTQDRKISDVYWTALRSITHTNPVRAEGLAVTAIRIRASEQLSGVIEELNGVVSIVCPDWDAGTQTWIERPTGNPASLFRHVLQGPANPEPLADADIDLPQLQYWHESCETAGQTCNLVVDFETSDDEVLDMIAACGMAAQARPRGLRSVVIDEPAGEAVIDLSPRNMMGFRQRRIYFEQAHAFRVAFTNELSGWKPDERLVFADGHDETTATRIEDLELPGVTNPDLVHRLARRHMATAVWRQETTEVDLDWRHLAVTRGDVIRVAHDAVLWGGNWGRVASVATDGAGDVVSVTLDDVVIMEAGIVYGLRVQNAAGTSSAWPVRTVVGEAWAVEPDPPIPAVDAPEPGDHAMVGERGRESVELVVLGISPGDDLQATLVCAPYDERIFRADTEAIPPFESRITPAPGTLRPIITAIRSDETVARRQPDGSLLLRALASLFNDGSRPRTSVRGIEVRWREVDAGAPWQRVSAAWDAIEVFLEGVEADALIEVQARFLLASGAGQWSARQEHTVVGPSLPPPDPLSAFQDGDVIRWEGEVEADHAGWLLRYTTVTGASWAAATPLQATTYTQDLIPLSLLPRSSVELLVKAVTRAGIESIGSVRTSIDHEAEAALSAVVVSDRAAEGYPGDVGGAVLSGAELVGLSSAVQWPDPQAPAWPDPGAPAWDIAWDALEYRTTWAVPAIAIDSDRVAIAMTADGDATLEVRWTREALTFIGEDEAPQEIFADTDPMPPADLPFGAIGRADSVHSWRMWRGQIRPSLADTLEIRIRIRGGPGVQPRLKGLVISLLAVNESVFFDDQPVGTGGVRLPTPRTFRKIIFVSGTLHIGSAATTLVVVDKTDPAAGALVRAIDADGTPVAATADLTVIGV
ncbi:MAG: hypothetical protein KDH19_09210 [Geminicoccaceae bacterium]|nr:hypothetical protein [Geminicoccaceae bacterium]